MSYIFGIYRTNVLSWCFYKYCRPFSFATMSALSLPIFHAQTLIHAFLFIRMNIFRPASNWFLIYWVYSLNQFLGYTYFSCVSTSIFHKLTHNSQTLSFPRNSAKPMISWGFLWSPKCPIWCPIIVWSYPWSYLVPHGPSISLWTIVK